MDQFVKRCRVDPKSLVATEACNHEEQAAPGEADDVDGLNTWFIGLHWFVWQGQHFVTFESTGGSPRDGGPTHPFCHQNTTSNASNRH